MVCYQRGLIPSLLHLLQPHLALTELGGHSWEGAGVRESWFFKQCGKYLKFNVCRFPSPHFARTWFLLPCTCFPSVFRVSEGCWGLVSQAGAS